MSKCSLKYYKIIDSKRGNFGWKYSVGIHKLSTNGEQFDTDDKCARGGLYYTTMHWIFDFINYGDTICEVFPLGKTISIEAPYKYKTDELEIISMHPLNKVETWEYMIENGLYIDTKITNWASFNNNFEILKWAHKINCPMHENVCKNIIMNNNFEILEWARINNFLDYESNFYFYAAEANNLEMLKWGHQNKIEGNHDNISKFAIYNNNVQMLRWAYKNYRFGEFGEYMFEYMRVFNSEMIELLQDILRGQEEPWSGNTDYYYNAEWIIGRFTPPN